VASAAEVERAGNPDYQNHHMSELFQKGMSFSGYERDHLYLNGGDGKYLEISGISGLDSIGDGRGCSFADLDNDGDLDVVVVPIQNEGRLLYRNNVGQENGFLRVGLEGTRSARDAFGAVVRLRTPLGTQTKVKLGGSGFVSASDPRLVFGLGPSTGHSESYQLEVVWPSGLVETYRDVRPGQSLRLVEGAGTMEMVSERRFTLPDPEPASQRLFHNLAFRVGQPLPELSLMGLSSPSSSFTLRSLSGPGRKTLVNFWATWCIPCSVEMPELSRLHDPLSDAGVDLIGISLDFGRRDAALSYLEERSIRYTNFLLDEKDIGKIYASPQLTVPLTLLIDEAGRVLEAHSGWSADTRARLEALAAGK
jgi:thiol-disulfide isomerase/thioredoxin